MGARVTAYVDISKKTSPALRVSTVSLSNLTVFWKEKEKQHVCKEQIFWQKDFKINKNKQNETEISQYKIERLEKNESRGCLKFVGYGK